MGLYTKAHRQKTEQQCYQACIEAERTGKEKTRSSQKQLLENRGQRGGQGKLHLETDREIGLGQKEMEGSFQEPLLMRE